MGEGIHRARIDARVALMGYATGARDGRGLSAAQWQEELEQGPASRYACALPGREVDAIIALVWLGRFNPRF